MDKDDSIPGSPGKIRPTQLITIYGPGSILQTEHDSVMIMGIDFWAHKESYIHVRHAYLEKITGRSRFKMPYAKEQTYTIACRSYPTWGYCTKCQWLQQHGSSSQTGQFTCKRDKEQILLPARLIVACRQGHVGEFPWVEWAHSNKNKHMPLCKSPRLQWIMGNKSSSIGDSKVVCSCGSYNYMHGALKPDGIDLYDGETLYKHKCKGELPWLDDQKPCRAILPDDVADVDASEPENAIGMLTRATSLYYARVVRGIIIPQLAHPLVRYLESDAYEEQNKVFVAYDFDIKKKAEAIIKIQRNEWQDTFTKDDVIDFMQKMIDRRSSDIESEEDLKEIEYDDLMNNRNFDDNDDELIITDVNIESDHGEYFTAIRRLDILTAIEVSRYFTRLTPPGDITSTDKKTNRKTICELEKNKNDWLPCAIRKGEGIFIIFNKKFIQACLHHSAVKERLNAMIKNHDNLSKASNWPSSSNVDAQYILLHSLSHMLIKELAPESGYGEASISERIYSSQNMCGLLLYTSSSGDGSLGGLARQAENVPAMLRSGLESAQTCSRDPLCIGNDPTSSEYYKIPLHLAQNGSACYGCMLLPETSCENFNKLLDRKILVDDDFGVLNKIKHD